MRATDGACGCAVDDGFHSSPESGHDRSHGWSSCIDSKTRRTRLRRSAKVEFWTDLVHCRRFEHEPCFGGYQSPASSHHRADELDGAAGNWTCFLGSCPLLDCVRLSPLSCE